MTNKILAATRLKAYSVPMAKRPGLIKEMMESVGCDEKTAKWYLENEDWLITEAIWWYKADKKSNVNPKV